MCPSSGETSLSDTLYLLFCMDERVVRRVEWNLHRITSTKCHINTVVSPDDWYIVARNMSRLINILRIICAPSCLYLQDYNTDLGTTIPTRSNVIFEAVTVVTTCHLSLCHIPKNITSSSQNCFREVAKGKINSVKLCFAIILTRLPPEILKTSAHKFIILASLRMGTRRVPLILRQAYYCKIFESILSSTYNAATRSVRMQEELPMLTALSYSTMLSKNSNK